MFTNYIDCISELESNLHSRIVEVTASVDSVTDFVNKPTEKLIEYDPPVVVSVISPFETKLKEATTGTLHISEKTWTKITDIKLVRKKKLSFFLEKRFYLVLIFFEHFKRLGVFACNIFVTNIVKEMTTGAPTFGTPIDTTKDQILKSLHLELSIMLSKLELRTFPSTPFILTETNSHLFDFFSSQVSTLVDLLLSYKDQKDFHAIIFVQRRTDAEIIAELLDRIPELKGFIKSSWLVGHGNRGTNEEDLIDSGMKIRAVSKEMQILSRNLPFSQISTSQN